MANNRGSESSPEWTAPGRKVIPIFPCASASAAAEFYTKFLGFALGGLNVNSAHHANMCSVFTGPKAAVNIYLFESDGKGGSKQAPGKAMVAIEDSKFEEYYEKLASTANVKIIAPARDTEWGYRQFEVEDIDGNRLLFFRFLSS